jgi:mannose-1-phosphate guanylyltransferase / mannose-6-phosphate isomerase
MIRPVILAGGSGTRLWPLSREHYPKQFLSLLGEGTMLQQTVLRLEAAAANGQTVARPLVVCNEDHRFLAVEQLEAVDKAPEALILEPMGKNTAPALTLAALWSAERDEDATLLVMPADHHVAKPEAFGKAALEGDRLAQEGMLVTFGVPPTGPETGYGYIRVSAGAEPVGSGPNASAKTVAEFVEKPDIETAKAYLATGEYLWNSGTFMVRASVWLQQIEAHRPDIASACRASYSAGTVDGDFFRPGLEEFRPCPSDSIDYAVAENATGEKGVPAAVVPLDAGWSDVGSWSVIQDRSTRDRRGNVLKGDVVTYDVENSLMIGGHRLLAGVGIKDLVVVETPDAVLIAGKGRDQEVRQVVAELRASDRDEQLEPRKVHRPWGTYEVIERGEGFLVKHLTVKPGSSLSLQRHESRAEHWVVVSGNAAVESDGKKYELKENQSTYVPQGVKHRLSNPGELPLEIIEVQTGSYLGEDDIERFQDDYGRV